MILYFASSLHVKQLETQDLMLNVCVDTAQNNNPDKISSDDVTAYATKISGDWKKLAPHLDLKPNTIKEIEEDSDDVVLQVGLFV